MKYFRTFTIVSILVLLYSSCVKKANYPDIPAITYNSFIPFCSGSTTDSAYIRINFTDGNGDIGYPAQQEGVPHDFFIVPLLYVYATKTFEPITQQNGDSLKFAYNIPDITPSGSDKELNGIIQINMEGFLQEYISDDVALSNLANLHELQFMIWIYDRAGNKSNVLITPTVYTCQ